MMTENRAITDYNTVKENLEMERIQHDIEIKALEEKLRVAVEDGYKSAINKLRELKKSDISKWSHSRSLYFAPVELSDFLLIQLKNNKALELITKANAKPN